MRILAAILGALCFACAAAPPSGAQSCEKIDGDSKKAITFFIDDTYGVGGVGSEDAEEIQWAHKVLVGKGREVLPCLLEVYRHGPTGDLWRGTGAAPTSGAWALPLIRAIDAPSAVPLYRELYAQASDDLTRVLYASELVAIGDVDHLPEVVSFLDSPPLVQVDRVRAFSRAVERALVAVSVRDHRAALPVLQKLARNESIGDKHVLAVYIAQLSGDADAVKAAVGDSRLRDTALLVLKRMGKEDILRQIAEDRTNPAHESAALVLQGRLGR